MGKLARAVAVALLLNGTASAATAATSSLETVTTPRGAKQSFIQIRPEHPVASVILFAGGHGGLGLKSPTSMAWGARNFLVRSRSLFAARGLLVAVIDAPSDRRQGMNGIFRMSPAHAADIGAVAAHLKKQLDRPVWLVGTSMGTFSAARGAIGVSNVDGLVLTSTITRAKPDWKIAQSHRDGVASLPLGSVTVPTLIVSHRKDGCDITPAADATKLKERLSKARKVEIVLLDGGSPPQSEPCEAMSQHGFLGIEEKAVDVIVDFVKANGR
ncbi:MAG TPA: hypothetical protein VJ740_01315 [Hyphomicrobiaceae bacterium]|nr:hypothetical protein [Hyphomicrobiaceae bacterium]